MLAPRKARLPIVLAATALVVACPVAGADDTAPLFDPAHVSQIDVTLDDEARQALVDEPTEYVDAGFSLVIAPGTAGERTIGPMTAEVKLKGTATFRPLGQKSAFKVKFPKANRPLGLKGLTLNNMVQDPSMLHEVLGYEALRAAGVPAPRAGYASVRVDGDPYGLYANVEQYDTVLLGRLFASTQHLYEADAYAVDVTAGNAGAYEVDEGDEDDRSDLEGLIGAANAAEGAWWSAMQPYADLDQMTRMWAGEQYIGHWDGYSVTSGPEQPNNYYLHSDAAGRFSMLPWGLDQSFVQVTPFPGGGGLLMRRCLQDAACLSAFRTGLREVSAAADRIGLQARVGALAKIIEPWRAEPDLERAADATWRAAVAGTRGFIAHQRAAVEAYLDPPVEQTVARPRPPTRATTAASLAAATAPATPAPAADVAPRFPAKLGVERATVGRATRRLSVLSPITSRAEGGMGVTFQAAGEQRRMKSARIDSANRRVRFSRAISARQARLGTGIVTLAYRGDDDTLPHTVRLRAAPRPAHLDAGRPRISAGRLTARGTVAPSAHGVVRVQLSFDRRTGPPQLLEYTAPIAKGRYALDVRLDAAEAAAIADRSGPVHSSTLFTGHLPRRMRGEMQSYRVLGAR